MGCDSLWHESNKPRYKQWLLDWLTAWLANRLSCWLADSIISLQTNDSWFLLAGFDLVGQRGECISVLCCSGSVYGLSGAVFCGGLLTGLWSVILVFAPGRPEAQRSPSLADLPADWQKPLSWKKHRFGPQVRIHSGKQHGTVHTYEQTHSVPHAE